MTMAGSKEALTVQLETGEGMRYRFVADSMASIAMTRTEIREGRIHAVTRAYFEKHDQINRFFKEERCVNEDERAALIETANRLLLQSKLTLAPEVLFVDEEEITCRSFARYYRRTMSVITADSYARAEGLLEEHASHLRVLITDEKMSGDACEMLQCSAVQKYPYLSRLLCTAHTVLDSPRDTNGQGGFLGRLPKPFDSTVWTPIINYARDNGRRCWNRESQIRLWLDDSFDDLILQRTAGLEIMCRALIGSSQNEAVDVYRRAAEVAFRFCGESRQTLRQRSGDPQQVEAVRLRVLAFDVRNVLPSIQSSVIDRTDLLALNLPKLAQMFPNVFAVEASGCYLLKATDAYGYLFEPTSTSLSMSHAVWLAVVLVGKQNGLNLRLCNEDGKRLRIV